VGSNEQQQREFNDDRSSSSVCGVRGEEGLMGLWVVVQQSLFAVAAVTAAASAMRCVRADEFDAEGGKVVALSP
jgi:hypothetical protein